MFRTWWAQTRRSKSKAPSRGVGNNNPSDNSVVINVDEAPKRKIDRNKVIGAFNKTKTSASANKVFNSTETKPKRATVYPIPPKSPKSPAPSKQQKNGGPKTHTSTPGSPEKRVTFKEGNRVTEIHIVSNTSALQQ